jgi:membrane protease YdiL (CAAX protease family)
MYPLSPPAPAPAPVASAPVASAPVAAAPVAAEPAASVYAGVAAPAAEMPDVAAAPAYVPDSRFVWNGNLPATADSAVVPVQEAPPTRWTPPPADPTPPMPGAPGWAAPPSPPAPGNTPARTGALGSWGAGSTGYTVTAMIALGGLLQFVFYLIARNGHVEPEAFVRYAIVGTVTFYAVVAVVVTQRVRHGGVRLMWTVDNWQASAMAGAALGLGLGIGLLAMNSAAAGHLTTDPNAQIIASEGDIAHIAALVLLTMIAAPLVEETLFRGLFAESMRAKGTGAAIWISSLAFAAWHWPVTFSTMNIRVFQTVYYTALGALLARQYWKGGLVRSMTAHACFNGVLTVAAIYLALSPATVVQGDGFAFDAPRGWHLDTSHTTTAAAHVIGPSEAEVFVGSEPVGTSTPNADFLLQRLQASSTSSFLPGVDSAMTNPREVTLPIGTAVEADMVIQGHHGELVMVPTKTEVLVIGFGSGGSAKATADFQSMLQSLRVA